MGFSFACSVGLMPFMLELLGLLLADFALCGERPALASAQGLDPKALLMPAALFFFSLRLLFFFFFAALAFFFFCACFFAFQFFSQFFVKINT